MIIKVMEARNVIIKIPFLCIVKETNDKGGKIKIN